MYGRGPKKVLFETWKMKREEKKAQWELIFGVEEGVLTSRVEFFLLLDFILPSLEEQVSMSAHKYRDDYRLCILI